MYFKNKGNKYFVEYDLKIIYYKKKVFTVAQTVL